MRRILVIAMLLLTAWATPMARQSGSGDDGLIGKWAGTYDGDATGKFGMTFARDTSKKLGGTIDVMFDGGGGYTATFKTIDVQDKKVTLTYESPENGGTITLEGTLDGMALKGTWKVYEPGTTTVVSSGTHTSTKS